MHRPCGSQEVMSARNENLRHRDSRVGDLQRWIVERAVEQIRNEVRVGCIQPLEKVIVECLQQMQVNRLSYKVDL